MIKILRKLTIPSLVLMVFYLSGCFDSPKEVVMPSWDVELNVPLKKDFIYLGEILDTAKNPNIGLLDSAGVYDSLYFIYVTDLGTQTPVQDSLKIPFDPLAGVDLDLSGPSDGSTISSAIVFNPDPEYHVDTAEFKSGAFLLQVVNDSDIPVNYTIELPGFKSRLTGEKLAATGVASANSTQPIELPLEDYTYAELKVFEGAPLFEPYDFQNAKGFLVIGRVSAEGSVDINFTSQVNSSTITMTRMVGSIARIKLPYASQEFETGFGNDIQNFKDAIDFKQAKLNIRGITIGEMENLQVVMDSLTVTAFDRRNDGSLTNRFPLRFDGAALYKDSLIAGELYIRSFNEVNTNLNDFLLELPDVIRLANKILIAPSTTSPDSLQVVSDQDSIRFDADLTAPLIIRAEDAQYADTSDIDISDDNRSEILKMNSFNLSLEYRNKIGLSVLSSVTFVDENMNTLFMMKTDDGSSVITIPPATVGPEGRPTTAAAGTVTLVLDKPDIEKFAQAKYLITQVAINSYGVGTSSDTYVRIRAKDHLEYRIYGGINYRVESEDGGE
ncbi:MAG: hypothetical protein K9J16_15240 [Melioribacteraceae bacterium]|nr:hypothetical protein [Melioribacteraceae bacterium]MCF8353062.1 hypothetical protein [Melioribacteraceae bacterium]MCF8392792.1 hypothetical protein [Melioribacteraceae bacterium]MCF8418323.1 hypothetical protein [Melioribacteraceae bacterium]